MIIGYIQPLSITPIGGVLHNVVHKSDLEHPKAIFDGTTSAQDGGICGQPCACCITNTTSAGRESERGAEALARSDAEQLTPQD